MEREVKNPAKYLKSAFNMNIEVTNRAKYFM